MPEDYGKEPSTWYPPIPLPKGIQRVKNPWGYSRKIEDFYQQFMGPFLASSVETVFRKNNLPCVHTVIEDGHLKMGQIWCGAGGDLMGLNGRFRKDSGSRLSTYFRA